MTTIPTAQNIFNDLIADLETEFSITINPFGRAFLVAIAGGLSGIMYLIYLLIGGVQGNIWVDTCDIPTLIRYGVIILGRYPFSAVAGQYTCTISGSTGAVLPASTVYKSDDDSESPAMLFKIAGSYTMPGPTGTIVINALTGGLVSRLAIGDTLTPTAPILNVTSTATVSIENTEPVDAENNEDYRTKVIEKVQLTAGSWSAVDYRLVGTGITGVYQTYAYAVSGASNEVNVFLQGATPVAYPGPSVSPTVVTNYTTALDLVLPLTVFNRHVMSSPINNIDITITAGSFTPFTTAQQSLVTTALTAFVNGVHPYIASCDNISTRNDVIATFNLSVAISGAVPGFAYAGVTFTASGTPTANWQADNGNIPFLNSVTFA